MAIRSMRSMIGGLTALALLGVGSSAAWAESAAEIAVREAQQYAGTEITCSGKRVCRRWARRTSPAPSGKS